MKGKILVALLLLLLAGSASAGDLYVNSISYQPAPAPPGSVMVLWVFVTNDSGYAAEESLLKVSPEYPFSLQAGQEELRELGEIAAYKTVAVEYKVLVDPTAVDGQYTFEIMVGEKIPIRLNTFLVSVLSRTPKLEVIGSDVTGISPGAAVPVNLTIKNVGGSVAKNIVIKTKEERTVTSTGIVVEREIVALGALSNYVEKLDQSEETVVQLQLSVNQDAELKNYSVPITMEYYDINGTARTDTAYIGMKVTADAQVDAVVDSVEPFAFPGMSAEITVDLFNLGLADAKYVVVEVSGAGLEVEEPRQFIGTLEADDFDSFKTGVRFAPTVQPGNLPVILKVIYKDDDLQERVETKVLNVRVLNAGEMQAEAGGSPLLMLVGLFFLAMQLLGLFVFAKFTYGRYKLFRGKK